MRRFFLTGAMIIASTLSVQAKEAPLSGRAAFVIQSVAKHAALKIKPCPGKIGNSRTRCAVTLAPKKQVQRDITRWKGWKMTDSWRSDSATFTSNGKDGYAVSVIQRIGNKGTLVIWSEF